MAKTRRKSIRILIARTLLVRSVTQIMRNAPVRPARPRSFRQFLAQTLRHLCPGRNDQVPLKIFHLVSRIDPGDWISRERIAALWPNPASSDTVSKGITRLRRNIAHCLPWVAPHCLIELQQDHDHRPTKYRLSITRLEPSWFLDPEFVETQPWTFTYAFAGQKSRTIDVQVWANAGPKNKLDVDVQRAAQNPTWKPPSAELNYKKARNDFFQDLIRKNDPDRRYMHDGDIWGLHDVRLQGPPEHLSLHLQVTRIKYSDGVFLKQNLDEICPFVPKRSTYRQYLAFGDEPWEHFLPPVHRLCLSVVLVAFENREQKTGPHIFLSRQYQRDASSTRPIQWDLTAAGVVSSSRRGRPERAPHLREHVRDHLIREVGVPTEDHEISWLGFARAAHERNSTLIALAEVKLTPAEVMAKFDDRHSRIDVDRLVGLPLAKVLPWLDTLPVASRREFLELGIALTAIRYGMAAQV